MAEHENGHCTGCGYHYRRGHRPYCWRKVTMMVGADASMKNVRRCLVEMEKHHRIISLFLKKNEHVYYSIESIDRGETNPTQHS